MCFAVDWESELSGTPMPFLDSMYNISTRSLHNSEFDRRVLRIARPKVMSKIPCEKERCTQPLMTHAKKS